MSTIKNQLIAFTAMVVIACVGFVPAVFAYANMVTYSGQGLMADGFGGYDLNKEICGVANGADVDGPYLLWVLTASKASHADITFNAISGNAGTFPMTKFGNGAFKYISPWLNPGTLAGNVKATYDGNPTNAQLVVSHGCRPFNDQAGAWCSPGFWGNATDAAWALTGYARTDAFNVTVYGVKIL